MMGCSPHTDREGVKSTLGKLLREQPIRAQRAYLKGAAGPETVSCCREAKERGVCS